MGSLFNSGEIMKLAIQIEKNGAAFYERAGGASRSAAAKKLFEFLRGEELKHLATFEGMLLEIDENDPGESYKGEQAEYMMALAQSNIFPDKFGDHRALDDAAAISVGIGIEKDSILFYSEMRKYVGREYQKTIDDVISQEKEHFRRLARLKKG